MRERKSIIKIIIWKLSLSLNSLHSSIVYTLHLLPYSILSCSHTQTHTQTHMYTFVRTYMPTHTDTHKHTHCKTSSCLSALPQLAQGMVQGHTTTVLPCLDSRALGTPPPSITAMGVSLLSLLFQFRTRQWVSSSAKPEKQKNIKRSSCSPEDH